MIRLKNLVKSFWFDKKMSFTTRHKLLPVITLALVLFTTSQAIAQDIHFTQFNNCVQLYNPALTGQFEHMLKGTLLHKKQWRNVGSGYSTSGVDAQYKLLSLYNANYTGFGLLVLQDEAGKAQQKTFLVKGTAAYHLEASSNDLLSAGFQLGYEQRSINFDGLAWDSQYNGVNYDPTLDDKERFITNKRGFVDFGAGINWKHKKKKKYNLGYGMFHGGQQITMVAKGNDKLNIRQVWHATWWKRYDHFDLKYDAMVQRQAGAMEIILGTTFSYRIGDDSKYTNVRTSSAAVAGLYYRHKDAIHPFVGFEYKRSFTVSLGYDMRVAKMPYLDKRPGGVELSLSYLGALGRKRMKVVH
jgi:type IX secretion system PorP/SprF family membrane protein